MLEYSIDLLWDDETQRWSAINDEIPLTLESGSLDVLMERCRYAAPEMLELNGKPKEALLNFIARRTAGVFA